MAKGKKPRKTQEEEPRVVNKVFEDEIPPGATPQAHNRPIHRGGGLPGSGGGPRHGAGEPGGGNTSTGLVDKNPEGDSPLLEDRDATQQGPPYAGPAGGAVGGTPAQRRASGGRTHHGIAPHGDHRGDSTVGADPDADTD
jgi:hypothetical protein